MTGTPIRYANERLAQYLDHIGAALQGPRRRRQRVLAELREGVEQSAVDRTATGIDPDEALIGAIDEFGHPSAVAQAFDAEMAIADARRIIGAFIVTGPLVGIWWLLLLHPARPWHTGAAALLAAIPVIPLIPVGVVAAAATFAATGRLIRWLPEARPQTALAAAAAIAALVLACDITILAVGWGQVAGQRLGLVAATASLIRIAGTFIALRRCARWRHRLAVPQPGTGSGLR